MTHSCACSFSVASETRHKFTGKERDTESGLDMFGARYYGSSLGRFMTPDWAAKPTNVPYASFGNPQSLNLYSYVNNNPTTTRDPDGHCPPCGEDLIEDLALEHPEAAEAVVDAFEEVVGEGTAVAESEGPAVAGSARWGLLAGPALFISEMINPHTTVGGDKPQAQQEGERQQEAEPQVSTSGAGARQGGTRHFRISTRAAQTLRENARRANFVFPGLGSAPVEWRRPGWNWATARISVRSSYGSILHCRSPRRAH
jgi:RHS repeat-associated protein